MPLTSGGASSLAVRWWAAQAQNITLHTGVPVTGDNGNELTTTGYRQGGFGSNPWNYDESTGTISNANRITLGTINTQSAAITHYAITDASGQILWRDVFATAPGVLAANTALEINAGNINIRIPFE